MSYRSKEHPLCPLGDPFYTRLPGTLIPGCWGGRKVGVAPGISRKRNVRRSQERKPENAKHSASPGSRERHPLILIILPSPNSRRPLYPFSVPNGHLRPLSTSAPHISRCLSFSVSALLLSSALLTVNFADIPVYLGDTKGETHTSVALGKSPLPTHRGVGLLPQCVRAEGGVAEA